MNNKLQILKVVGGIAVFIAAVVGLFKYKGPDVTQQDYNIPSTNTTTETVDSTEQKQDIQEIYDAKVQSLQDSLIMLKFKLYDYENKITDTKNKSDEKVNTIISNDADQLVKFLSDRYKDSIR